MQRLEALMLDLGFRPTTDNPSAREIMQHACPEDKCWLNTLAREIRRFDRDRIKKSSKTCQFFPTLFDIPITIHPPKRKRRSSAGLPDAASPRRSKRDKRPPHIYGRKATVQRIKGGNQNETNGDLDSFEAWTKRNMQRLHALAGSLGFDPNIDKLSARQLVKKAGNADKLWLKKLAQEMHAFDWGEITLPKTCPFFLTLYDIPHIEHSKPEINVGEVVYFCNGDKNDMIWTKGVVKNVKKSDKSEFGFEKSHLYDIRCNGGSVENVRDTLVARENDYELSMPKEKWIGVFADPESPG